MKNNDLKKDLTILSVIQSITTLNSGRFGPSDKIDENSFNMPPLCVWSFTEVDNKINKKIINEIKNYKGSIIWDLKKENNKWILYPNYLNEIWKKLNLKHLNAARSWIYKNEPTFGRQANEDLFSLTIHLKNKFS